MILSRLLSNYGTFKFLAPAKVSCVKFFLFFTNLFLYSCSLLHKTKLNWLIVHESTIRHLQDTTDTQQDKDHVILSMKKVIGIIVTFDSTFKHKWTGFFWIMKNWKFKQNEKETHCSLNRPGRLCLNVYGTQKRHGPWNSFDDQCKNHTFLCCDQTDSSASHPASVSEKRQGARF